MEIMPCTREIDCASVAKNSGASRFSTTGGTTACASGGCGAGDGASFAGSSIGSLAAVLADFFGGIVDPFDEVR